MSKLNIRKHIYVRLIKKVIVWWTKAIFFRKPNKFITFSNL